MENLAQITLSEALEIEVKEDAEYKIRVELIHEDVVQLMDEESLHATELVIEELRLAIENGDSAEIRLSWNDISNLFYRYGYRIYRSLDGKEWETRSSWNGIEKVSVLNIYPNYASRNYLSNWMEQNVSSEASPAGKGLFEIDKVSIDDYNRSPDTYLKDENGYKYDVLVFGTYDCNGGKDLNEKSYEATRKFAESGRGILFGHDTVTANNVVNHPVFARFADDLGIKLTWNGQYKATNTVRVVNSGFLTGYPWKLSGVLKIPTSHALGQFTGGSNTATVWMEFTVNNRVDTETEGRDNAYLCSQNQLALIQTGHSNGQATDDERKVLANTMFYLKQVTNATETVDKSAVDMEKPGLCEVNNVLRSKDGITMEVQAEDFGTKYYYYVEAVPQSMEEELRRESQTVETVVLSGIQGYQIAVNTSPEPCEDNAFGEVLYTENNRFSIPEELLGEGTHLHIRAVDNHGNAGEETVIMLPEKEDKAWLHTGYSLFGSQGVTVYCSTLHTAGDVYSGSDVTFGGSNIVVNGACNAVGRINAYVGSAQIAAMNDGCEPSGMPDYEDSIRKLVSIAETVNTLNVYNSKHVEEAVYCKQMVCAYCPEFVLKDSLVCEGNINLGVNVGKFGTEEPVAVYSANGNISINASTFSGTGIIYAPNGTVTINVAEMKYSGSIIAKQIILQGSVLRVDEVVE